ncbi:hypothetical protein PAXRUDRAFT_761259 [Paxillus rubicundulus Ve08.2h10]|uniref:Uncharacterized protein n=1 Tax=Paxillus rubicundulus Ve08.2h10 TaxID=930991 RepID=A0A0D0DIH9_9AGAM|nr:hypothetical protein PAXRUDRAFT_761259 [Paxillus rubicundulus Ve08.2h10]
MRTWQKMNLERLSDTDLCHTSMLYHSRSATCPDGGMTEVSGDQSRDVFLDQLSRTMYNLRWVLCSISGLSRSLPMAGVQYEDLEVFGFCAFDNTRMMGQWIAFGDRVPVDLFCLCRVWSRLIRCLPRVLTRLTFAIISFAFPVVALLWSFATCLNYRYIPGMNTAKFQIHLSTKLPTSSASMRVISSF